MRDLNERVVEGDDAFPVCGVARARSRMASGDRGLKRVRAQRARQGFCTREGSETSTHEELVRGLKQALATKVPTLAQREDATRFMRGARDALAERNRAVAREFLAGNSRAAGVTTTPSGLEYRIAAAGDPKAKAPGPNDQVTVRYRASLADGTEFDSSYARGQPATFKLNGTLKGWREALTLMKPGAKWQLWVPPALGYDAMSPPPIPPGSLLIYELELVKVEPPGQIGGDAPKLQAPKPAAKKSATPADAASAPK